MLEKSAILSRHNLMTQHYFDDWRRNGSAGRIPNDAACHLSTFDRRIHIWWAEEWINGLSENLVFELIKYAYCIPEFEKPFSRGLFCIHFSFIWTCNLFLCGPLGKKWKIKSLSSLEMILARYDMKTRWYEEASFLCVVIRISRYYGPKEKRGH